MRKRRDFDFYVFDNLGMSLWFARDWDDLVIPITHNWHYMDADFSPGIPVDWGIEPILQQVQKSDSWRDDSDYQKFCDSRNQKAQDKERSNRNEFRAIAADMRKDFARSTNDINTSSLERSDKRRLKWR